MAHLYYVDGDAGTAAAPISVGTSVTVGGDEGRHAVKVARLRVGETVLIGDGRGRVATATVTHTIGSQFTAHLDALKLDVTTPRRPRLTLVQALAKGDRDERAVEQATEFGVDEIRSWQAHRSVSRWSTPEKREKGQEKWRRIAREASKQAIRAWIPDVDEFHMPGALDRAAGGSGATGAVFVLDPRAETALSEAVRNLPDTTTSVTLIVGPEGGITSEETEVLSAAGALRVRLGSTVLRTSSAGAAGIAVVLTVLGEW